MKVDYFKTVVWGVLRGVDIHRITPADREQPGYGDRETGVCPHCGDPMALVYGFPRRGGLARAWLHLEPARAGCSVVEDTVWQPTGRKTAGWWRRYEFAIKAWARFDSEEPVKVVLAPPHMPEMEMLVEFCQRFGDVFEVPPPDHEVDEPNKLG